MRRIILFSLLLFGIGMEHAQSGDKRVPAAAASRLAAPEFRDPLRSGGQGPVMVRIPGGRFEQGSPSDERDRGNDEGPVRTVTVRAFSLGKYEVTRGQFRAFVKATGYRTDAEKNTAMPGLHGTVGCFAYKGGSDFGWKAGTSWRDTGFPQGDDHPVACLSWNDASAYVEWLRRETGKSYRLPSESELEYANRAGTARTWAWGNDGNGGCRHANYGDASAKPRFSGWPTAPCKDGYVFTASVGSFLANAFGLHDTTGNVWEWTQDCYHGSYNGAPTNGSAWTSGDCSQRVLRGGAWGSGSQGVRAAVRFGNRPANRNLNAGLRLAQG